MMCARTLYGQERVDKLIAIGDDSVSYASLDTIKQENGDLGSIARLDDINDLVENRHDVLRIVTIQPANIGT